MPYNDPERQKQYQRQWIARRRAVWFADKVCAGCGSTSSLELHHLDPSTKVTHRIWSWAKERREAELAKCQVLCFDCHLQKSVAAMVTHQHGTWAMVGNHKCKCAECLDFQAGYKRARRARGLRN